jgi:hypothetical protein
MNQSRVQSSALDNTLDDEGVANQSSMRLQNKNSSSSRNRDTETV